MKSFVIMSSHKQSLKACFGIVGSQLMPGKTPLEDKQV